MIRIDYDWQPTTWSEADVELGSRFINAQIVEYLARLGMHNWRLSDDERFFLHRYLYLSTLEAFRTLGIRYIEQDPLLKTDGIIPQQVPDLLRVPTIPPEDITEIVPMLLKESNGH